MAKSWTHFREFFVAELEKIKLEGSPKELYEPINYILDLGGKRIRPVLCLMAADLFDGNAQKALSIAIAVEVFHNFTLVHDDIMDEAPLRRGKATVHEKWNRDIAILSGDVMMVKAYEFICQADKEVLPQLLTLFNQTAIEVCEGQQFDMNFELVSDLSIPEYIKMIQLKTAVLLACSLKMGAITAGATTKDAGLIYEFGKNIGIAFQIQDDYLDAYADPDQFGKRVGGDIISNKKTYLLLTALEQASVEQKEQINQLLNNKMKAEPKVNGMLKIYNELNVPQLTKREMEKYYATGMNALKQINCAEESKTSLVELANILMNRQV